MKVKVVAYRDRIIIVPDQPENNIGKDFRWYPTGDTRLGCVIGDTKINLGVSEEALALMKTIKRGHDAIGDIDWWGCDDETYAFSWWGPIYRIINPATAEAPRNYNITDKHLAQCTIIPNEVPDLAKQVIDSEAQAFVWNKPIRIEVGREL